MASDYSAARQEFVDRINAEVSTNIPFIQKRVNYGKDAINKNTRSNGIIHLYVPAGGTGGTEELSDADGIKSGALDRTDDTSKANASYYEVKCYAHNGWELFSHSALEDMFQIGDIDKNIVEGRKISLTQNINKDLVSRNWTRANGACVAGSDEIGFVAMNKAISILEVIKASGSWTGFMSPMFKSKLGTESAKKNGGFDVPDEIMREMYGRKGIGRYADTDWVNEAFMPEFTTGALNTTDTESGITVKADVSTQGATEITITGFTASGTIKKGTPFTVEGVYDVTMGAGLPIAEKKVFIVQADASAVADSDKYKYTLKVLPMYFNDSTKGYQNNLYNADSKIPAEAEVKGLCAASTTYYTCLIKEDRSFNWTPFALPDVDGCKNTTTSTDDLTIQLVSGGDLLKRYNSMRFDSPYFGDIVDPRANRLVYYKK